MSQHPQPADAELLPECGGLPGARRDHQSVTRDWHPIQPLIDGVVVKEVLNVTKNNGILTEVWRADWGLDGLGIGQVFQNYLAAGSISSWHVHRVTTDRIFVNYGLIKVVLYDARKGSSTHGRINEFRLGLVRPAMVVVPPGVWHLVQNLQETPSLLLNLVDRAYDYENPDHWRLPPETTEIPYRVFPEKSALAPSSAQV
jgi:dTDP-4-dehydrorhamnose 3,5-epimerase